jgi:hypothetical protein
MNCRAYSDIADPYSSILWPDLAMQLSTLCLTNLSVRARERGRPDRNIFCSARRGCDFGSSSRVPFGHEPRGGRSRVCGRERGGEKGEKTRVPRGDEATKGEQEEPRYITISSSY